MSIARTQAYPRLAGSLLLLALCGSLGAQDAARDRGREIMTAVYERPTGPAMTAELEMSINTGRGAARQRSIRQYSLDKGGVERKLMYFTAPADVRDTSFMTWSHGDGKSDDRWIYLPAVKRVKRIAADRKDESFMGSDFTYDDLGVRHPARDEHRLLREESLSGRRVYVVESVPRAGDDAAFGKILSWIDAETYVGLKREYYDKAGVLYKRLDIGESRKVDGYWVVIEMTMSDLKKSSSTKIVMRDLSFSVALAEDFFSERQMQLGARK